MIETYPALPAPPAPPAPPAAPESWRDPQQCPGEGFDLIRETEDAVNALGTLWRGSLQRGAQAFPFEALDPDYREFLGQDDENALQNTYAQDKRAYDRDMKVFSKARRRVVDTPYFQLPFIDAFNKALEGKPAREVYYPRNEAGAGGYEWFSGNERVQQQNLVHAYSLPAMGKELQETP
jgi:hypothetical protein